MSCATADKSWDHLMVLIYAQLSGAASLRSLEAGWNAHNQHHYHLGSGELRRSTLSDASRRRPNAVFTQTFELLAGLLDRQVRRDGSAMLRIIDSTPFHWASCATGPSSTAASAA
jgi:putative transposase